MEINSNSISLQIRSKIKYLFIILLIFCCLTSFSTKYYISNIGNDFANGTSTGKAWQTISKVNKSFNSIKEGDTILFKGGDLFYGFLVIKKNKITIDSYGTGKAIFNGFKTLSEWTDIGNGIWQSASPSSKSTLNMVTVDGKVKGIGRYPNSGFLIMNRADKTLSIQDNELTDRPNWSGAEVVIRANAFSTIRCPITSHVNNTINYKSDSPYTPTVGFGYFIQKSPLTLDQLWEWYFDRGILQIYFGAENPSSHVIKASVTDTLLSLGSTCGGIVRNIEFRGANEHAIYAINSSNVKIEKCNIKFCGHYGIYPDKSQNWTIDSNLIEDCLEGGQYGNYGTNDQLRFKITNNTVKRIRQIIGMARSHPNGFALWGGKKSLIEYNYLDSLGYSGIRYFLDSTIVRYNYVGNFLMFQEDGGGIYCHGAYGKVIYENKSYVYNNIVENGYGYYYGTNSKRPHCSGIYGDCGVNNVDIFNNSIINVPSGVSLSSARNVKFINNNIFNATICLGVYVVYDEGNFPIPENLTITGNVVHHKYRWSQYFVPIYYNTSDSYNDIAKIGTWDCNYYLKDTNNDLILRIEKPYVTNYTFAQSKSVFGIDTHSTLIKTYNKINSTIIVYNASKTATERQLDFPMKDVFGNKYYSSIKLQPFTSTILIPDPNPISTKVTKKDNKR